jgi:large subunit ribosomal protein L3
MVMGIVGRKCGMTRIFNEAGNAIPVTVIEAQPNRVTQVKATETDGYRAVQVTWGSRHAQHVNKATAGHLAKASVEPGRGFCEFRITDDEGAALQTGHEIAVTMFSVGQKVDVIGITKGKGFAGVIKRYNFDAQDATHGNSLSHRAPGSIGQNQSPGRVFKGKKMAGQLGQVRRTTQNLEVVKIDTEKNVLLIRGAVPGAPGGDVIVRPAIKVRPHHEGKK